MLIRASTRALACALGSIAVPGCTIPADLPDPAPVVWVGQQIEVASNVDEGTCGGTWEYLDAFVAAVSEDQQLDAGDSLVRYYLLARDEVEEVCQPAERCSLITSSAARVYTFHAVDAHELLHATRGAAAGKLPGISFFEEGLAMMYGFPEPLAAYLDVDAERDVHAALASLPDLHDRVVLRPQDYGVAGDFTRYLEVTYGIEEVAAYVADQDDARSVDDVEEIFADAFGEGMQTVIDRYHVDYPACSHFARTKHIVECTQPPVQPDEDGLIHVDFDLSCESPDVVGPVDGVMWRSFTFEVDTLDEWLFEAPRPDDPLEPPPCHDFSMEVVDCDRGCLTTTDLAEPHEGSALSTIYEIAPLQPGRYVARLSRTVDNPGRACLDIGPFVP